MDPFCWCAGSAGVRVAALKRLRNIDDVGIKGLVGQAADRQELLADDVKPRFGLEDWPRLVIQFCGLDGPFTHNVFLAYLLHQVPDAVCAVDVGNMEAELVLHLLHDLPKYLGLGDEGDSLVLRPRWPHMRRFGSCRSRRCE